MLPKDECAGGCGKTAVQFEFMCKNNNCDAEYCKDCYKDNGGGILGTATCVRCGSEVWR